MGHDDWPPLKDGPFVKPSAAGDASKKTREWVGLTPVLGLEPVAVSLVGGYTSGRFGHVAVIRGVGDQLVGLVPGSLVGKV